jgi:hypothetical protein
MLQPLHHLGQVVPRHREHLGQLVDGEPVVAHRAEHEDAKTDVRGSVEPHEPTLPIRGLLKSSL